MCRSISWAGRGPGPVPSRKAGFAPLGPAAALLRRENHTLQHQIPTWLLPGGGWHCALWEPLHCRAGPRVLASGELLLTEQALLMPLCGSSAVGREPRTNLWFLKHKPLLPELGPALSAKAAAGASASVRGPATAGMGDRGGQITLTWLSWRYRALGNSSPKLLHMDTVPRAPRCPETWLPAEGGGRAVLAFPAGTGRRTDPGSRAAPVQVFPRIEPLLRLLSGDVCQLGSGASWTAQFLVPQRWQSHLGEKVAHCG